jgi:penicillin-binding protein 1A
MAQRLHEPKPHHARARQRLTTVPARHAPDEPEVRRLAFHEAPDRRSVGSLVVLPLGVVLAFVVLVAVVVGITHVAGRVDQRFLGKAEKPLALPTLAQRSTIFAADGSVLERVYLGQNRVVAPLNRFRRITRRAVLAVEDSAFFEHGALDPRGIVRAAIADLQAGHIVQGGSTITQQLVKDTITGDAVTWQRKLTEAIDAIRLENTYPKRRILGTYLNEIYLGHSTYGFPAAAQYYFGLNVPRLSLTQSALLAGMIQAPNFYDPLTHPVHAHERRNEVLRRMLEVGWIDRPTYVRARRAPLALSTSERDRAQSQPNSFLTQYVIQSFLSNPAFGKTARERTDALFGGGLRIYTTLEPNAQRDAERVLANRMGGSGMPQAALASIVPNTGAITAMAQQNWPWAGHRYSLVTTPGGGRTAGSAFKAFTLAAALEQGISPNAVYDGTSPRTIPDCGGGQTWTVHNAEPGGGSYPLWRATADSVNAVFAQVIDQVGPDEVARVAHRMGITSALTPVCPLTLGTSPVSPLQMTSAYATLANNGVHCTPYVIDRVVSPSGHAYQAQPDCTRAIPKDVATEETAMLQGVVSFGTGTAANIGRPQAGKTGTGQDYQDAWFVGYVPQLTTGVWVGYAKAEIPMRAVPGYGEGFGGVLAAPIWHDYMELQTRHMPVRSFPAPPIPVA